MTSDLSIIEQTGIIEPDKLNKLINIKDKLEDGFKKQQIYRPRYLMEVAVLKNSLTPDAKYWQSNLERKVQFQNLIMLCYDYQEKQADIMMNQAKEFNYPNDDHLNSIQKAEVFKLQIQTNRMQTQLIIMQKEADERVREILEWTDIMDKLEPELEFSKDNPEEHMPKSFPLKFAQQQQLMKIAGAVGATDMNGAMNILALTISAFNNPKTKELIEEEKKPLTKFNR